MDLVMEEKPTSSDCPLVLTTSTAISSSTTSSTTPQMSQQMVTSSVPSIQPSFTSGVPTLLTPSQMSSLTTSSAQQSANATSKYAQLLQVIEELGKDIRPTYSGSKSSAERLKRGIVHSRILVRECLMETERNNARN